ncbi:MAG: hypothetical protein QHH12_05315 [Candidatus Bathyarchaeota archaeon]|nr:hypothetical protein [Candidatus Bathyarchaeota archaeon A05DMB-3]MDH7607167.1 hypothetical protein [Candidatus Bathyarchaeota archaeon]
MNRSWKTVSAATAFNMLFEYSMRGVNNLAVQPLLPFVLFAVYFSLYTMLEDLIAKYRLKDYHLLMAAFFFGTAYQFLVSGSALLQPSFLDVDWTSLLFVVVVWWGNLQSIVTFYFANRIAPRDWNHRLSKKGWATALAVNCLMVLLFQLSGAIPKPTIPQLTIMLSIMALATVLFKAALPKGFPNSSPAFQHSRFIDFFAASTVGIFLFCATFLTFAPVKAKTSNVNATATAIVTIWTIILASAVLAYRTCTKRPIPV